MEKELTIKRQLTDFLVHLSEKGLIDTCSFSFLNEAEAYLQEEEKKKTIEKYTLEEVRQLLHKKLKRFSQAIYPLDNSGFAMGEQNMASIIDDFLKYHSESNKKRTNKTIVDEKFLNNTNTKSIETD